MAHYKVKRVGLIWFSGLSIANSSYLQAQLQSMSLDNVEEIGKKLGRGAYGVVVEVRVSGLVCAGKTLHESIIQVILIAKTEMITTSCYLFIEWNIRQVCWRVSLS